MEPLNKTELDFKNKLDAREIAPSDAAWDRLDAMLAVSEDKKPSRGYGWLYMAASIIGFLAIGAVFLSQTETVVDQPREVVLEDNVQIKPNGPSDAKQASTATVIASAPMPNKNLPVSRKSIINQNQSINNQGQTIINQNPVETVAEIPDHTPIVSTNQSQSTLHVKVDELLAAVQSEQVNPRTSVKVNAKNLLSEVDKSVNLSFREKMLRRASEVADAVVNRNNE